MIGWTRALILMISVDGYFVWLDLNSLTRTVQFRMIICAFPPLPSPYYADAWKCWFTSSSVLVVSHSIEGNDPFQSHPLAVILVQDDDNFDIVLMWIFNDGQALSWREQKLWCFPRESCQLEGSRSLWEMSKFLFALELARPRDIATDQKHTLHFEPLYSKCLLQVFCFLSAIIKTTISQCVRA